MNTVEITKINRLISVEIKGKVVALYLDSESPDFSKLVKKYGIRNIHIYTYKSKENVKMLDKNEFQRQVFFGTLNK